MTNIERDMAPANDVAPETPPAPAPDQDEMTPAALAEAVLAREIRPRAASIRRLAEAVLAAEADKRAAGKGKAGSKKGKAGKKKKAKAGAKKRKLAKIPGQSKDKDGDKAA